MSHGPIDEPPRAPLGGDSPGDPGDPPGDEVRDRAEPRDTPLGEAGAAPRGARGGSAAPAGAGARGARGDTGPSAATYAGLGFQFLGAILLFLYVGRWLDARLGTRPWLLIVGVLVGAGAGFYSLYRKLMKDQAREDARPAGRNAGGPRR